MRIGVNSRIVQHRGTGIPYYVYLLYSQILKLDKVNSYTFLQTSQIKTIGKTEVINLPGDLLGAVLFDNFFVNKLIYKSKIEIFHSASTTLPLRKVKGVKYITTIYDLAFLVLPHFYTDLYRIYHKFSIAHSLAMTDIVVCISESTKRDIIKFFKVPQEKIVVIYPGVNDTFRITPPNQRLIAEKYFFSVATHPSRKNILGVLSAMAESNGLKDYIFVIAGLLSPKHIANLEKTIDTLKLSNRVRFLGYVSEDDLKTLYKFAELSIYPSFYEGFGLPVLEAMISRCLVLTADNSSLPEVNPNREWMFDASDVNDIKIKMERMTALSQSEKEELITKNYQFAQKFTWEKSAKSMLEILTYVR